jgi:hypothetical protein
MAADSDGDGTEIESDDVDGEAGADSEWRFSLDEIDARQGEQEDSGGNVAGSLAREQPLEPGDINRENALFVVLGVLVVVVLIAAVIFGF